MTTSGSYNFGVNRNDIVTEALEIIGEYQAGEAIDGNDLASINRSLNLMIKHWQSLDYGLWLIQEAVLYLENDTVAYDIGPTGDHCTPTSDGVKTELAAAAAAAATSITLDSVTGMTDNFDVDGVSATGPLAAGAVTLDGALVASSVAYLTSPRKILIYSTGDDSGLTFAVTGTDENGVAQTESITGPNTTTVYSANAYKTITAITSTGAETGDITIGQVGDRIGVELTSGDMQWSYIGNALSTTTTLIDALTGAAAIDNHVYVYSDRVQRPLDIIEARRVDQNDMEISCEIVGRTDYMGLPNKTNEGKTTLLFYDPQLSNGKIYLWPEPDSVKDRIYMSLKRPVQDFDSATDTADFPQEWYAALCWNLALWAGPKFGKPATEEIKYFATSTLEEAKGFDREHTSTILKRKRR